MTITTVEIGRSRSVVSSLFPPLVPVALLMLVSAPLARAEWKFQPTVSLRQTYTDNARLARSEDARSRFITSVSPGFSVLNDSARLTLRADYSLHYYASSGDGDDTNSARSQLQAAARATLLDDLLFFDGSASIAQQAISAFGPQVNDNDYARANRTDVKTLRLSPYLRHQFGSTAQLLARYSHDEVDSGRELFGRSSTDTVMVNLASGPLFRRLGWGLNLTEQQLSEARFGDSSVRSASANLRYMMVGGFSLTGTTGYDEYDYQSLGGVTKGRFWNLGFNWVPSSRTSVSASAGKRFYGDSYSLRALHRSRRSVWNINYDDTVANTRGQSVIPAGTDTAATIDRLLMPQFPDPLVRAQAVDAFIRANNLPAALADNLHYLSNRYSLYRQLRASAAFNLARTTLILSTFGSRREALSVRPEGSPVIELGDLSLNDNVRQRGASAMLSLRLTGRSALNVSLTDSHTRSDLADGREASNTALRVAMTRRFSQRARASVELHTARGATSQLAEYRENAVSAALSLTF